MDAEALSRSIQEALDTHGIERRFWFAVRILIYDIGRRELKLMARRNDRDPEEIVTIEAVDPTNVQYYCRILEALQNQRFKVHISSSTRILIARQDIVGSSKTPSRG